MERDAFALMAAAETDHWWFRGRREFIAAGIERALSEQGVSGAPGMRPRLLDAGCGSGGNLSLMARYGELYGFEYDAEAAQAAAARGVATVATGSLPDGVPFGDTAFDLIGMFDVLEHLEHPVEALRALGSRLVPGGAVVLTVPALPMLWGPHDVTHQHFRRYAASTLRSTIVQAGLQVDYLSYFNMLLLPLAVLQRVRERFFGYDVQALIPAPAINELLYRTWRMERAWVPRYTLPLGLSLMAIARPRVG